MPLPRPCSGFIREEISINVVVCILYEYLSPNEIEVHASMAAGSVQYQCADLDSRNDVVGVLSLGKESGLGFWL